MAYLVLSEACRCDHFGEKLTRNRPSFNLSHPIRVASGAGNLCCLVPAEVEKLMGQNRHLHLSLSSHSLEWSARLDFCEKDLWHLGQSN